MNSQLKRIFILFAQNKLNQVPDIFGAVKGQISQI